MERGSGVSRMEPSLRWEPRVPAWLLDPSPVGLHVGEQRSPAWRGAASFSLQVSDLVAVRPSAGRKQTQLPPLTVSSEPQLGP